VLTLTFTEYPALLQSGGSVSLKATGYQDPNCGQSGIIVVQKGKGQYVCFSSSCTHACCEVAFSGGEFKCPCHGTVFDLTGKPTGGPANGNLPSLAVCADSCGVHVTLA
jgi:Rieske Fe-S protein